MISLFVAIAVTVTIRVSSCSLFFGQLISKITLNGALFTALIAATGLWSSVIGIGILILIKEFVLSVATLSSARSATKVSSTLRALTLRSSVTIEWTVSLWALTLRTVSLWASLAIEWAVSLWR